MRILKKRRALNPAEILVFGFGGMILIGAVLLCLPIASTSGESVGFLTALFSSTSAICVTGLTVIEIGTAYTLFGQFVMLVLIQLGGIGFMTATSMVYMLFGRRITLKDRLVIRDSLNESNLQGVVRMTRNVLIVTLISEVAGMLLLSIRFIPEYGVSTGIYYSLFHSVSAFCNAGFDILGLGNSIVSYAKDPLVLGTIMGLIVIGGLGFFVVVELYRKAKHGHKYRFSLHTKIVLIATGVLLLAGFAFFLAMESGNPKTLGAPGVTDGDKILGAAFQSVTTRTAGFASIPQANLTPASKIATVALMFIGASPSGTGGGIKTTTAIMLLALIVTVIRGKNDVVLGKRRINKQLVLRAITIITLATLSVAVVTVLISIFEQHHISVSDILYEVTSAFGTVGLSCGITASLSPASQILLILTMFGGRVGFFTVSLALAKRMSRQQSCNFRYPEDKIMIG